MAWLLIALLLISFVAGGAVGRALGARRLGRVAAARRDELRRLYAVAEAAGRSDDPVTVIATAQEQLVSLLGLRSCRFDLVLAAPQSGRETGHG